MSPKRILLGSVALLVAALAGLAWFVAALGPLPPADAIETSTVIVDHEGRLLRPYATAEGRWRLPATVDDVDPRFIDLLLSYEDKRFRGHGGIDTLAMLRAAWLLASNGRIVSGGSTVTMQIARLLEPRSERTLAAKLRQMVRAVQLERAHTKDEILSIYLTLAPYGGNLEGIRAATLSYFGKEPRRLTLPEMALLVALPQSPETRRPDRAPEIAQRARDRVLDRAAGAGLFPDDEIALAKREPVPTARKPMPMLAPHAADQALLASPGKTIHRLTIEAPLQKALEALARARA
ncbi:MAG: transglycosylase domain-containing protein, partial [Pseudorhodoplanes sp.]|nr:transglycosylase domain-containing protein [Pseudorhodoplanes sp.]